MPKTHKDFPAQLSFGTSLELKQRVIALSYLRGNGGMYAAVARDLISDSVIKEIGNLDTVHRADFEEILQNVKMQDAISSQSKKAQT